jgi:hypothetical protein
MSAAIWMRDSFSICSSNAYGIVTTAFPEVLLGRSSADSLQSVQKRGVDPHRSAGKGVKTMDVQILQTLGATAGLAGLAVGMILLLYRELLRKKIFPRLSQKDAYRLLRNIALLSWSVAMAGIICWGWSQAITHPDGSDDVSSGSKGPVVVAGTAVDQMTNAGVADVRISIPAQGLSVTSEDNGNFRIVFPRKPADRVRLSARKRGYEEVDESVMPPVHDLILQMRPAK